MAFSRNRSWTKKRTGNTGINGLDLTRLPRHVAIIMDGNGRWAKQRGLPRAAGHRAGVETLRTIVEACCELGIPILTVYAFSTENWKRPEEEVSILMKLIVEYLRKEVNRFEQNGIRINPIGKLEALPEEPRRELYLAAEKTKNNNLLLLNVALNYGGRAEIVKAATDLARQVVQGKIQLEDIDENLFAKFLYTGEIPDPDLLIRPSGELRISNYLLWQLAYTEFWFTDTYWPDFRREHFVEALRDFQSRERRFGGLKS